MKNINIAILTVAVILLVTLIAQSAIHTSEINGRNQTISKWKHAAAGLTYELGSGRPGLQIKHPVQTPEDLGLHASQVNGQSN